MKELKTQKKRAGPTEGEEKKFKKRRRNCKRGGLTTRAEERNHGRL